MSSNLKDLEWKMWARSIAYTSGTYGCDIGGVYNLTSYMPGSPLKLEEFFILANQALEE